MNSCVATDPVLDPGNLEHFLRAEPQTFCEWVVSRSWELIVSCASAIIVGAALYGAAIGSWRDGWQALYSAVKLPLVFLLTALGNGLLNGMLAPLLGLNVTLRQSLALVLVSFTITALILGGLGTVALFLVWNTSPLTSMTRLSSPEYGGLQLTLVGFISLAGIAGNVRLLPLLRQWTSSLGIAVRVLFAWLAVNLFLGSQIAWVLRPFIWDPSGPAEFIGRQYFHGSFYETTFEAARRLFFN